MRLQLHIIHLTDLLLIGVILNKVVLYLALSLFVTKFIFSFDSLFTFDASN